MPKPKPVSKTKKWWKERNKRRKARYHSDPDYKKQVNRLNRLHYRKVEGSALREPAKLSDLAALGTVRKLLTGASRKTYSIEEMAKALGDYHKVVLYRWIRTERFPRPSIATAAKSTISFVYSLDQARALIKVFSEHQKSKAYFHKSDTETVEKLFDVMRSEGV
jgi:hypothetical protein